jgi:hypothetical protein
MHATHTISCRRPTRAQLWVAHTHLGCLRAMHGAGSAPPERPCNAWGLAQCMGCVAHLQDVGAMHGASRNAWGAARTSRTSAEPQREETERLPCLATRAPAAAASTHAPVEMFTEPMPSPPVPTMSTTSYGVSTSSALRRMQLARPASSSAVSPAHACMCPACCASRCTHLARTVSDALSDAACCSRRTAVPDAVPGAACCFRPLRAVSEALSDRCVLFQTLFQTLCPALC